MLEKSNGLTPAFERTISRFTFYCGCLCSIIFLDESGDLGFDFTKLGTTKYFVVTVLALPSAVAKRAMEKAVERTIKNKINQGRTDHGPLELKGAKATAAVKTFFYRHLSPV